MKQAPAEVIAVAAEEQAYAFIIVEKVGVKERNSSRHKSPRFQQQQSRAG